MLLPYASDRPPKNPPLAVVALVLSHFLIFGIVAFVLTVRGPGAPVVWYANLSLIPGALHWYSFFTYSFLHEDVFHLSANMLFLWVFGGSTEEAIGWRRFLLLYFGASVATGALQLGVTFALPGADRLTPIVGSSGAVAAILGVFAVRFYRSRIRFIGLPVRIPAIVLLVAVLVAEMAAALWQVLQFGGSRPQLAAAHWAHVGGFFLGLAFAQATRQMAQGKREYLASDAATEMAVGDTTSAVRRWEAVLQSDPASLEAMAALGGAWAALGDRAQSISYYRRAVDGYLKRGAKRDAARCFAEMRAHYRDAILDIPSLFAVAGALEESGDLENAVYAFEACLKYGGTGREAEMATLRAGILYLNRMRQPERAAERLATFIARFPGSEWRAYGEDMLRRARSQASPES